MLVAVTFIIVFMFNDAVFRDDRYNHGLTTALYSALLLLPLKTVFFEEAAFRGLLPAILGRQGRSEKFILGVSSAAFGLWHVRPALAMGGFALGQFFVPGFAVVIVTVLATAAAGAFLYLLRRRSDSLLAPVLVHWFINGFAIVLASLSWS